MSAGQIIAIVFILILSLVLYIIYCTRIFSLCNIAEIDMSILCWIPFFNIIPLIELGDVAGDGKFMLIPGKSILVPRKVLVFTGAILPIILFMFNQVIPASILVLISNFFVYNDLFYDIPDETLLEKTIISLMCAIFNFLGIASYRLYIYENKFENGLLISQSNL